MGMSLGGGRGMRADINMTPMIDVLLVLIIIFMVIVPTKSVGLDAQIPQPADSAPAAPPPHEIVISILADGSIHLNQEPVEQDQLEARLRGLWAHAGIAPIFIKGDRSLEYRRVADVIDIAHQAGIERIGLLGN